MVNLTQEIIQGDCLEMLRSQPDGSVNCCVTSPPYFGLRDYGHDAQIGLENTPDQYVEKLAAVFREVWRVLRDDGTLWLNLGDSYTSGGRTWRSSDKKLSARGMDKRPLTPQGLKPKDLIGIPWRVAFALQADGWYLRQDIIWHKPNPMPESVRDRCTKAHEYVFLFSKSEKYYFDNDAIKEASKRPGCLPGGSSHFIYHGAGGHNKDGLAACGQSPVATRRNRRSVWSVSTRPYPAAHFATFPPALIEPCILAGCVKGGIVLDPFFGSGTTGEVALRNDRGFVGIELNPDYVELAKERIAVELERGRQLSLLEQMVKQQPPYLLNSEQMSFFEA